MMEHVRFLNDEKRGRRGGGVGRGVIGGGGGGGGVNENPPSLKRRYPRKSPRATRGRDATVPWYHYHYCWRSGVGWGGGGGGKGVRQGRVGWW